MFIYLKYPYFMLLNLKKNIFNHCHQQPQSTGILVGETLWVRRNKKIIDKGIINNSSEKKVVTYKKGEYPCDA